MAAQSLCDWSSADTQPERIVKSVTDGERGCLPFTFLSVSDCAAAQLRCARTYVAREGGAIGAGLCAGTGYAHDRIRLAYLSGDFRDHAVAFLITGVLEQHDRQRFETIALSLRPEDPGHYGQRIKRAAEHFIDLSGLSDAQAAARIRELEVDILVDLAGFTRGARFGILARRPAPIQVNYLGFPATLGAPYIDYLIADEFLIPVESRPHYAEHIAYLPECFQANDDQRPRNAHVPTRSEAGLPASAIVLCCFNNSYKINPTFFSVWMRLLQATADSVLWLVADDELTQQNLRREAQQRGVDPQRLIFAARLPYAQHLARLALADLFLDTLPFNGGTTVSDALWANLPVLTCAGEAMAARMAGSLLHSIGLSELISFDLAQYEQLALELLHDRPRLAALRSRIASARSSATLFNTARLTRHLEAAYRHMHQTYQQHLPVQHFAVQDLP
jgi:predicted O-linked N-acetylglucosamine transferase (SPINDLY family)